MKQESVWDYPRPPRVEPCPLRIRVECAGMAIADSTATYRRLETSHPPTYYIPQADIQMDLLRPGSGRSFCEFKGNAAYWDLQTGERRVASIAWSYPSPAGAYKALKDHLAFYAQKVDACYVGDQRAQPQEGGFYGGWITSNLIGPFKGAPGTRGW
jgi:uncharacterized protein (DUF427 family)